MKKYIVLDKEKIEIKTLTKFKDRLKSFRFYLKDINYGLCFPKKKMLNTYFFCQRVDIIVTDKENNILAVYHDLKTEKKTTNSNFYSKIEYFVLVDTAR